MLWSFQGRIGRLVYLSGNLVVWALAIAVAAVVYYLGAEGTQLAGVVLLLLVAMTWSQLALAAKRFHDLGKTGLASLLLFVPLAGLVVPFYLLFAPGEEQDNQYGPVAR
jgi:uncharacterized membrane protein YhaH (DUF805 family)